MRKKGKGSGSGLGTTDTGLVRMRIGLPVTRRDFGKGALGAAAAAGMGLHAGRARAATSINYMGWNGYDLVPNTGGFLDANDMYLDTTYIGSPEEIFASATSGGAGYMDLVTPQANQIHLFAKTGIAEPIDIEKIPNYEGLFPEFKNLDLCMVDGVHYAVPFSWGSLLLMWNAEAITDDFDSWWVLFEPEYKGKIVVVNDMWALMVPFLNLVTERKTPTRVTKDELDEAVELLIKFKHQVLTFADYGEVARILGANEAILAVASEAIALWAGPDAPPFKWNMPKEGGLSFVDVWAMIKDCPHRELNHQILNHILSPEAQAFQQMEATQQGVVVGDAVPLLSAEQAVFYPYDDIPAYFERAGGVTGMWPLEPMGDYVTYDEVVMGWERVLAASY